MQLRSGKTRRIALTGMLFALAIALSFVESTVASFLGVPGVKLGLANIVVMYALLFLSNKLALLLVLMKAGFAFLTRGAVASLLSATGGLLSFVVMALLLLPKRKVSILLLSVAGSLSHNMGQLVVVYFMLGTASLYYGVILILSGIGMGVLTALSLRVLMPALQKVGYASRQEQEQNRD